MIYPPNQKPPIWSIDPGVIAYNCQRAGMPHPVLAMPMWEGAGNRVMDYSGHGNHGAITGAGWVADGLEFVSTESDYIKILDAIDPTEYTISVSIRPAGLQYTLSIITRTDSDSAPLVSHSHELHIDNKSKFKSYLYDGAIKETSGTTTVSAGTQYHVVGTAKNNDYLKLYVNGVQEGASVAIGSMWNGGDRWNVGMSTTTTNFANGIIYDILIFHTAISAAQAKFLSDNPYFMYQIPEELYGYSPAAVGAIMNQFQKFNVGADLYNGAIIA